jgi:hypothetical protein
MRIDLFHMERTQCLYENEVRWNLSESGVEPLTVRALLDDEKALASLPDIALKYPAANGSRALRERIAAWYGAAAEDVLVTNGTSEANYTVFWGLLEPRDRVAVMIPNYLQTWGLARAYAGHADPFRLVERGGGEGARWALDLDSLDAAVTRRTKILLVTNPNNPSGAVLTNEEMDAVVRAARRAGAWIVADEVYRGAETGGPLTPTFWGRYEKVIVTSGLSKAFGLPGLRIGWIVAPPRTIAHLWSYQDYTTLTPTMVSDRLAAAAMEPARRDAILARTRALIAERLPPLEAWIGRHADVFTYIRPRAGAIALLRYDLPIDSAALFERLRLEQSVLITPGAHFGIGAYIRIGYGYDPAVLQGGLRRIDPVLEELVRARTAAPGRGRRGRRAARRRANPKAAAR